MSGEVNREQESGVGDWNPRDLLSSVDELELRYSSGFLRCQPEKWFPNLSAYWLPFAHSLGSELKVLEIRPILQIPEEGEFEFFATIDGEPLGVSISNEDARTLLEVTLPEAKIPARSIMAEYLARRFLSSLAFTWSASESSVVRFDRELRRSKANLVSAVKVLISFGGFHFRFAVLVGSSMTDRLDQLWRKHMHSRTAVERRNDYVLSLELARLDVPAVQLAEYLRPGTLVDLEIPVSDRVELLVNDKPWLPARLRRCAERFISETVVGSPRQMHGGSGLTRLSVQIGSLSCSTDRLTELSQPSAMQAFEVSSDGVMSLVVGGEHVGNARLHIFERRFAIRIL